MQLTKMLNKKEKDNSEILRLRGEIPRLLIISFVVLFISEWICRGSFLKVFGFFSEFKIASLMNYLLVLVLLSVSVFFRKKTFVKMIIAIVVVMLSSVSATVNFYRNMPLQIYDMILYKEAFQVANTFMGKKKMLLAAIIILILIALLFVVYKRSKKYKRITAVWTPIYFVVIALLFIFSASTLKKHKVLDVMNWDIKGTYEQNGFLYSLYNSFVSSFRNKPEGYSKEAIEKIRREVDDKESDDNRNINENPPQVVYVQLEAFMDPTRIESIKFDKDPIPNVRKLMQKYTSGLVNVPVTGGGTARTEYEVLSGFSFDYLNPGEIPYETFLSSKSSISLATYFHNMGYGTTAIHNFYYTFYNRSKGYKSLGFDQFIPFETMTSVEYNPKYWPKDFVLNKYIMSKVDSGNKNFVFTVTTQGHSKYPTEDMKINMPIKVTDSKYTKGETYQIEYYANQLHETDEQVGKLISSIEKSKKPTIVVLYGDHLPALEVFSKGLSKLDLYDSLFVIYDNFGAPKQEVPEDFQAYQMSGMVQKMAGLKYSTIEKIHEYLKEDKDYQKKLEMVEYDVLFGNKYFLKDGEGAINQSYSVGVNNFLINKVEKKGESYSITGSGFNGFTYAFIDGERQDISYNTEYNIDTKATKGKKLQLKIIDKNDKVIKVSNTVDLPN